MLNMTPQLTQTTTLTLSQQAQLAIKLLGLSQEALDATLQAAATANGSVQITAREATAKLVPRTCHSSALNISMHERMREFHI